MRRDKCTSNYHNHHRKQRRVWVPRITPTFTLSASSSPASSSVPGTFGASSVNNRMIQYVNQHLRISLSTSTQKIVASVMYHIRYFQHILRMETPYDSEHMQTLIQQFIFDVVCARKQIVPDTPKPKMVALYHACESEVLELIPECQRQSFVEYQEKKDQFRAFGVYVRRPQHYIQVRQLTPTRWTLRGVQRLNRQRRLFQHHQYMLVMDAYMDSVLRYHPPCIRSLMHAVSCRIAESERFQLPAIGNDWYTWEPHFFVIMYQFYLLIRTLGKWFNQTIGTNEAMVGEDEDGTVTCYSFDSKSIQLDDFYTSFTPSGATGFPPTA